MNKIKFSSIDMLQIFGFLIFDISIILGFFNMFELPFIIRPTKYIIAFLILIIGIITLNISIICARFFYKNIGVPYIASLIVLSLLYFLISNGITIFLITSGTILYVVFELIVLAIFIFIFSIILLFSKSK